ncbi:hypothetical protein ACWGN5_20630 [Streptomyces sp. NPDC055815]
MPDRRGSPARLKLLAVVTALSVGSFTFIVDAGHDPSPNGALVTPRPR